jgi:hypothetical protein
MKPNYPLRSSKETAGLSILLMVVCVDFALLVYFDIFALNSSGSWFNKVKKASQKKKTKKKREKQEQEVYISTI